MASSSKLALFDPSVPLSGNTNGNKLGLSSLHQKFIGYLNISALGAGTTLTAKIQHSPNGTDWYDVVTFTAAAATGSEVKDQSQFSVPNMNLFPNIRGVASFSGGTTTGTVQLDLWYDGFK